MSKNYVRLDTPQQKELYRHFRCLADHHSVWQVWHDFVKLSACRLCLHSGARKEREALVGKYSATDLEHFSQMFEMTISALEQNPDQDFLGDLFMRFNLSNEWRGQFFTPYSICKMMAALTLCDAAEARAQNCFSVNDPACGSGAMLVAFAQNCKAHNINYQRSVLFVAQDIDETAALMCYVQLSLLGCPGYVIIGDSLVNPPDTTKLPNPEVFDGKTWYTPMYYVLHTLDGFSGKTGD